MTIALSFAGAQQAARIPPFQVNRSTKFELVINLNAVKQIGVTVPPNGLARTDRIVK